jgi:hypothetical protein
VIAVMAVISRVGLHDLVNLSRYVLCQVLLKFRQFSNCTIAVAKNRAQYSLAVPIICRRQTGR